MTTTKRTELPREHVSGLYWLTWDESALWATTPELQRRAIEEAAGRPIVTSHGLRLHPPIED